MAKKVTEKKPAQKPNLQKVTLENGEKVVMSARELRTLRKDANKEVESE